MSSAVPYLPSAPALERLLPKLLIGRAPEILYDLPKTSVAKNLPYFSGLASFSRWLISASPILNCEAKLA
jgi:hypothetical protein